MSRKRQGGVGGWRGGAVGGGRAGGRAGRRGSCRQPSPAGEQAAPPLTYRPVTRSCPAPLLRAPKLVGAARRGGLRHARAAGRLLCVFTASAPRTAAPWGERSREQRPWPTAGPLSTPVLRQVLGELARAPLLRSALSLPTTQSADNSRPLQGRPVCQFAPQTPNPTPNLLLCTQQRDGSSAWRTGGPWPWRRLSPQPPGAGGGHPAGGAHARGGSVCGVCTAAPRGVPAAAGDRRRPACAASRPSISASGAAGADQGGPR